MTTDYYFYTFYLGNDKIQSLKKKILHKTQVGIVVQHRINNSTRTKIHSYSYNNVKR